MIEVRSWETPDDLKVLRVLLGEYFDHLKDTLGAENMDRWRFEQELLTLPLPYEILLLAYVAREAAGCLLLKPLFREAERGCEVKRLWVRPQFRGLSLGRKLTESAMAEATRHGYTAIYLDTVPAVMHAANRVYESLGFEPVERYNDNPVSNVKFLRRAL
jgi:ribosomal protein S18 acetylase RimI-like enzyme